LVAQVADKVGLTSSLSARLAGIKQRRRGHDPGRVIRDLAVMLVDGGECVSDLGAVASDSTAFRMVDRVASTPGLLDAVREAHARARGRFWELHGAPQRLTLDVDATLITAHSEKEQAAGNYKGGYGFHPLAVYLDETREALGGLLRPGNAGSNTADDHKTVIDRALAQIPAEYIETLEILVRADSAGATHGLVDYCRDASMRFSVGYELTKQVRAAILALPEDAWVVALDQDGSERENGEVCEITDLVDLSAWPEGSRLIVRRERPHPGAQLSFTDHDGYRFQAILTDQPDEDVAVIECRHRQHAHVEDRIRDDKDTGLSKFPFKEFALNEVWLEIVMLAHDLLVWTQALVLTGELAKPNPSGSGTGCCMSLAGSRSRAVARSSTSRTHDRGRASSSPRSRNSRRCRPPAADTAASDHDHHPADRPGHQAAITAARKRDEQPTTLPGKRRAPPTTTQNPAYPPPVTRRRRPPVTPARLPHVPGEPRSVLEYDREIRG
jgi:hypothetical protein